MKQWVRRIPKSVRRWCGYTHVRRETGVGVEEEGFEVEERE
jgi:hypothetical protein